MNKLANVWVFSSEAARLPEVMAAGLQLGDSVSVFVLGGADEVARAAALGANKVYHLGEKDSSRIVEEYALTMAKAIEAEAQASLVLLPASRRGKALAAKLGVRLSAGVFNDAAELTIDGEGHVGAKHLVYGGLAIGEEKITSQIAVVTLAAGASRSCQPKKRAAAPKRSLWNLLPLPMAFVAWHVGQRKNPISTWVRPSALSVWAMA